MLIRVEPLIKAGTEATAITIKGLVLLPVARVHFLIVIGKQSAKGADACDPCSVPANF